MIFSDGITLVIIGLSIGLALGIGFGQILSIFLYGLPAAHIPTIVGTVLLFIVTSTMASAVPAMQAVREGWRQALQEE
jgi:hypothetical protein